MRKILLLLISISPLLSSGQGIDSKSDLLGTWNYYAGYMDFSITFESDSTFTYTQMGDMVSRFSNGTWSLQNDTIQLNSTFQSTQKSRIERTNDIQQKYYEIILKDERNNPIQHARVITYYGNTYKDTLMISLNGSFIINTLEIDSIKLWVDVEYKSFSFKPIENERQSVIILASKFSNYVIFSQSKWILKEDRIYNKMTVEDNNIFNWVENRKDYYLKKISRAEWYDK